MQLIFLLPVIYILTLSLLTFNSKRRLATAALNLAILGGYALLCFLKFRTAPGLSGIIWYLLFFGLNAIHWLINLTQLIVILARNRKKRKGIPPQPPDKPDYLYRK